MHLSQGINWVFRLLNPFKRLYCIPLCIVPCREKTVLKTIKSFSKTNASTTTASRGEGAEEVKPLLAEFPAEWTDLPDTMPLKMKIKNATGISRFGIRVYFYIFLVTKLTGHFWTWLPDQGKAGTRSIFWLIKTKTNNNNKKNSMWLQQLIPNKDFASGLTTEIHLSWRVVTNPVPQPSSLASLLYCHYGPGTHMALQIHHHKIKIQKGEAVPLNGDACRGRSMEHAGVRPLSQWLQVWDLQVTSSRNPIKNPGNGWSFWACAPASCTKKLQFAYLVCREFLN